jgi:hypothetical protein
MRDQPEYRRNRFDDRAEPKRNVRAETKGEEDQMIRLNFNGIEDR